MSFATRRFGTNLPPTTNLPELSPGSRGAQPTADIPISPAQAVTCLARGHLQTLELCQSQHRSLFAKRRDVAYFPSPLRRVPIVQLD